MIGLPYNDLGCLGPITEVVAQMVAACDPVFVELARQCATEESLIEHFRGLPQRDDRGEPDDGPRIHACKPSQRLDLDTDAPNCVERAAAFVGTAELIDPGPTRQLATVDIPGVGLHTFPVVNGKPIILDPLVTSERLDFGLTLAEPGPVGVTPRNAIAWTADLASGEAAPLRNGPSRIHRARNALTQLVDHGTIPQPAEVDAIGALFALAEKAAQRYGARAITLVQTTLRAIANILDSALARAQASAALSSAGRNVAIQIGGLKFETPEWFDRGVTAVADVGLDIGSSLLRSKLAPLGIDTGLIGVVESDLNEHGLSLGRAAHPPEMATFAKFAAPRTG